MKRTPLKRKKWMNRVSPRRKRQTQAYGDIRKELLAKYPVCIVCMDARSVEIHHKNGRHNYRLIDVKNLVPICRSCHNYIHQRPGIARQNGWLV